MVKNKVKNLSEIVTQEQGDKWIEEFQSWSGGWGPEEVPQEDVLTYIDANTNPNTAEQAFFYRVAGIKLILGKPIV